MAYRYLSRVGSSARRRTLTKSSKGFSPYRPVSAPAKLLAVSDWLRVLRPMGDLRRYASPVIVQNAGQVNIAADGGQQVNVQEKGKIRKKKPVHRVLKKKAGRLLDEELASRVPVDAFVRPRRGMVGGHR